eukprot:12594001-Heterocapsa_arctica.AAC.1
MFGFVQDRLVADKLQAQMTVFEKQLMAMPMLDDDSYKISVAACKLKISEMPIVQDIPQKRIVTINYRGIDASVQVQSIFEELECRWAAAVK